MKIEELARIFEVSIEARYPDISGNWMYSLNGEVKEGACLAGVVGRGKTVDEAKADYIKRVAGKVVVFNAYNPEHRKELRIPDDVA